jgi:hypothetical protein
MTLGAFGGVAGVFAVFFFSDIPRFRKDVMQVCALPIKMMRGEGLIGVACSSYWRKVH